MNNIDGTLNNEVGSVSSRAYIFLSSLAFLFSLSKPPDVILLVFSAAPSTAFDDNPHAQGAETIVSQWDLTEDRSWIPGFLQSIFYVGFMPGTIVFGQLSDRYGRKKISVIGYILVLIFQVITGFCQNWQQFAVCRAISGFLVGGLSVVTTILIQETTGSKLWVLNGALGAIGFTANMLAFLWVAYLYPSWRQMYFITTIPGILGFVFLYIVPESPRWLLSRGKPDSAEEVMQKLSRWNGSPHTDRLMLQQNYEYAQQEQDASRDEEGSIIDLIRKPVLRYRAAILSLQWFTASFVFYGITLGSGSFSSNFYVAYLISGLSQLPSIPFTIYLMERRWAGRRRTLVCFMGLAALCMFVMYIVSFGQDRSNYELTLLVFGKLGICGAFDLIYVYTAELFPTVVRNVGLGSMSFWARVGGVIAPFLANLAVFSGSNDPFLAFGIVGLLSSVFAAFLPETRAKLIPNTFEEAELQEEDNDENSCNSITC
ncbi:solute carrier family 22 member 15-like isoform X2 [Styela clava]